jgi:hypothetical protein
VTVEALRATADTGLPVPEAVEALRAAAIQPPVSTDIGSDTDSQQAVKALRAGERERARDMERGILRERERERERDGDWQTDTEIAHEKARERAVVTDRQSARMPTLRSEKARGPALARERERPISERPISVAIPGHYEAEVLGLWHTALEGLDFYHAYDQAPSIFVAYASAYGSRNTYADVC